MYGKTFTSLWEGSMVGKRDAQLVFIFLFSHCDHDGFVEAHPAVIAAKTGMPVGDVERALEYLQEPDPNSRSKGEDGRRIVRVSADHLMGWHVVNYSYYRALRKADERRAYHRNYWRTRRAKTRNTQPTSTQLNRAQPDSTHVDVEEEVEAEKTASPSVKPLSKRAPFKIPTEEDVAIYCSSKGIVLDAAQFVAFYQSKGWKVGNQPMKDWKAAVTTWMKRRQQERAGKPQGVTAAAAFAFADQLEREGR